VDISAPALAKLRERRAHVVLGEVTSLPFADDAFDLVCALDIIEHVDDDDGALSELSRVAQPGGTLLISTPLHPTRWTSFDDFVGHKRRYEPQQLLAKLAQHQLVVRAAPYLACSRAPRFSSTPECGGLRIIVSGPCVVQPGIDAARAAVPEGAASRPRNDRDGGGR